MSEFTILCLGAGILIFEYRRQTANEESKQDEIELEKRELKEYIYNLEVMTEKQLIKLHEMSRTISELQADLEKVKKTKHQEK